MRPSMVIVKCAVKGRTMHTRQLACTLWGCSLAGIGVWTGVGNRAKSAPAHAPPSLRHLPGRAEPADNMVGLEFDQQRACVRLHGCAARRYLKAQLVLTWAAARIRHMWRQRGV